MLQRERKPTSPGEILKEHYLKDRRITITEFAEVIGCSRKHLSSIINGAARIEAGIASRIAVVLGTTPQFWLNLQNAVDIYEAKQTIKNWKPVKLFSNEIIQQTS